MMENNFENALKYVRHLDNIETTWSESEKTLATAMLSYAAKTSKKSDDIHSVSKRFDEDTLEDINAIMWESYMVKDRNFGRQEGFKIMKALEEWAKR